MLANLVLFQHERAGRVGSIGPVVAAGLDIVLIHHKRGRICQLGKEVRLGRVNRDFERALVYGFDATYFGRLAVQHLSHAYNVA